MRTDKSTSSSQSRHSIFGYSHNEKNNSESLQVIIHRAIMHVGGYWPALSALARLQEEIGEYSEAVNADNTIEIADELADIWIISTCIANQYSTILSSHHDTASSCENSISSIQDALLALTTCAGSIARTINHYEGPKKPKPGEHIIKIHESIPNLHAVLEQIAGLHGIHLDPIIRKKVTKIMTRDANRFGVHYDPSVAKSVETFNNIVEKTKCPFAKYAKIWGSSTWDEHADVEKNIKQIEKDLHRFLKIAEHENLDGFVISAPDAFGDTAEKLGEFTRRVLTYLSENDPANENSMSTLLTDPEWHFRLNGQDLFIATFASCYGDDSSRSNYGANSTFILIQPEHSFKQEKFLPGDADKKRRTRSRIRNTFENDGRSYDREDILRGPEPPRYVKPLSADDAIIEWWVTNPDIVLPGDDMYDTSDDSYGVNEETYWMPCSIQ